MEIMDIMDIIDIMDMMDIMDMVVITDIMDIINKIAWMAMAGAKSALVPITTTLALTESSLEFTQKKMLSLRLQEVSKCLFLWNKFSFNKKDSLDIGMPGFFVIDRDICPICSIVTFETLVAFMFFKQILCMSGLMFATNYQMLIIILLAFIFVEISEFVVISIFI